jgi:hypothetical protein
MLSTLSHMIVYHIFTAAEQFSWYEAAKHLPGLKERLSLSRKHDLTFFLRPNENSYSSGPYGQALIIIRHSERPAQPKSSPLGCNLPRKEC